MSERRRERGNFQEFSASSASHSENSRKILRGEISSKKADWYAKNKRTFAEQPTVDAFGYFFAVAAISDVSIAPCKAHRGDIWAVLEHFDVTYLRLLVVQMSATLEKILRIFPRKILGTRCGLGRNLGKEHSSKQHLPSRELILLRSMFVMSDMSDRSCARVNLLQYSRLTLSWPCFARMSLIKRMILPVKTPVL